MMRRGLVLFSAVMVFVVGVAVLAPAGTSAAGGYPEPDADDLESILTPLLVVTIPEELWIAIGDVIDAAQTDPSALSALALTSERFTVFRLTDDFLEAEEPAGEMVPGLLGLVLQRDGTDVGVVFTRVWEGDDGIEWLFSDAAGLQCLARLRLLEPGQKALLDARRRSGVTWIVSGNAIAAVPECSWNGIAFSEATLAELQASYAPCAEPWVSCGAGAERPPMRSQTVEPGLASSAGSWSMVAGALGALVVAAAFLRRHRDL